MGLRIGLTGGVGSGKSTVAALLAEHGAVIIDADRIAREVVEPGTPGLDAIVATFGDRVLAADGTIDRAVVAGIVFADAERLRDLNAIVHPLVGERAGELARAAPADAAVVYDVPLLVENDMAAGFDKVLVVEAPLELRLVRLAERGMTEDDARSRIGAQASDEQRRAVADELIVNDGSREALAARVAAVWSRVIEAV